MRDKYLVDMACADYEMNQLGVATYLIDKLALRVGNEKGEDEADTVGCCSLRVEHISFDKGENMVTFDFLGKDSMRFYKTVEVLPIVYKLMKKFTLQDQGKVKGDGAVAKPKDPKQDIFDSINSSRLNDYLKTHMSDLSAKVFRTYNASYTLQKLLKEEAESKGISENSTVDAKYAFYNECNRQVALLCNHKKAESKNLQEQLDKIQEKIDDKKTE